MTTKYKGLDNRNLRLLNQSDTELLFQKYKKQIWVIQKSSSGTEAARKLKMNERQLKNLSWRLRKQGIPVKMFQRSFSRLPREKIKSLASIATYLAPKPFDHEAFVRLWQTGGPAAVKKEFGLNKNMACQISFFFRKQGVDLYNYQGLSRGGKSFHRRKLSKEERTTLQRIAQETATASGSNIPPHKPTPPPE